MSNMLEQAIIDAQALKEAAIKNAETAIVEHYALDIKEAVERLLEQPEEELGLEPETGTEETEFTKQVPHAAVEGEDFAPGEDQPLEIDFNELQARLEEEEEEIAVNGAEEMVDREEELASELAPEEEGEMSLQEASLYEIISEISKEDGFNLKEAEIEAMLKDILAEDEAEETLDEAEETLDGVEETLDEAEEAEEEDEDLPGEQEKIDVAEPKGKITAADFKKLRQNESLIKENKQLLKSADTHKDQIKTLKEQNNKYRSLMNVIKEKLNEVNLSNAKLLYTNRILTSDSLNERQKNKIVEAVTNTKTVEETKTIFDTLQSTVGSVSAKREPKSLSEVVSKRSAAFLPRREEKREDPFAARMKILAGIKKN